MWFVRHEPRLTGHERMPAASHIYRHIHKKRVSTPAGSHVCFISRATYFVKHEPWHECTKTILLQETSPGDRGNEPYNDHKH